MSQKKTNRQKPKYHSKYQSQLDSAKKELKDNVRAMEIALADEPEKHPWWNKHGQTVVFLIGLVMILVSLVVVNVQRDQIMAYKANAEAATSALSVTSTENNAYQYLASYGAMLSETSTDSEGYDEILACGNELQELITSSYSYPDNNNASISTLNEATEANNKLLSDIEAKANEFEEICKKYHPEWFDNSSNESTSESTDSNTAESTETESTSDESTN